MKTVYNKNKENEKKKKVKKTVCVFLFKENVRSIGKVFFLLHLILCSQR